MKFSGGIISSVATSARRSLHYLVGASPREWECRASPVQKPHQIEIFLRNSTRVLN